MRPDVEDAFAWQRQFLPQVKSIIGVHLIGEAPLEDDAEKNTDLIVLRLEAIRIACRIRTGTYLESFHDQFTIRCERPSGAKTELAKIIEGWGDYFFYGFGANDGFLASWMLGDLRVFRLWLWQRLARDRQLPGQLCQNKDGSSKFYAYKLEQLPSSFVVARLPLRKVAA